MYFIFNLSACAYNLLPTRHLKWRGSKVSQSYIFSLDVTLDFSGPYTHAPFQHIAISMEMRWIIGKLHVHQLFLDELLNGLKLCCIVSYGLNGSSRYFCRIYMKWCQISHVSFNWCYYVYAVELLQYGCLYLALF